MNRIIYVVVLALSFSANSSTAHAVNALQDFSGGLFATSAGDQLYGWEFDVLSNISVQSLGAFDDDNDGMEVRHEVGLYRVADSALLASVILPAGTGSTLDDGYRFEALVASVTLTPGRYVVAMTMPSGNNDLQGILNTSVTTAAEIAYFGSRFDAGSSLALPTFLGSFEEGMFGPNFQFVAAIVPEPATVTLSLLTLGGLMLRRQRLA